MLRIVLDTNVLIDADRGEGSYPKRILDLVVSGEVQAVVTSSVRREQELIVGRLMRDRVLKRAVEEYLALADEAEPAPVSVIIEDQEDLKLITAAVGGKAQFLVTADDHLLSLGEYQGCRIVTPSGFWRFWEQQDGGSASWANWAKQVLGR